jgi:hypothetical protein
LAVFGAAGSVCLSAYLALAPVMYPVASPPSHCRFIPRSASLLRSEVDCDPNGAAEVARKALRGVWSIRPQTGQFIWPDVEASLDTLWTGQHVDNWTYQYSLHSLFLLRHLVRAHQQEPVPEYLDLGQRVATSWMRLNRRDDPPCRFSWNDHAAANRAVSLCAFADYLHECGRLEDEFEAAVGRCLYEHGRFLSSPLHYTFRHNHGFFQDQALLVTATHLAGGRTSERWLRIASQRLTDQLECTYSRTGVHRENSPYYHLWITDLLGRIGAYLVATDVPVPATLTTTIDRAREVAPSFVMPNGRIVPVGDCAQDLRASYQTDRSGLIVHPEAGYASFRDGLYVFFNASHNSWTHKHCDDLAIIVADANGPIISDPGFLNYEPNDPQRMYSLSWDAHSTVTAEVQSPRSVSLRCGIDRFAQAGDYACVRGRSERRDGTVHTRWVLYDTARQIVLLIDQCQADRPVRWHRRFQFEPDIALSESTTQRLSASTAGQSRLHLTLWPAEPSPTVLTGQKEPLQGWVCRPFRGLVPAPMTVETQEGKTACYVAVLAAREQELELSVVDDKTVHLTHDDGSTSIRLAPERIEVTTHADPSLSSKFVEGTVTIPLEVCALPVPYGRFWPLGYSGRIMLLALVVAAWLPILVLRVAGIRRPAVWLGSIAFGTALTAALLLVYWPRLCFVF